MFLNSKLWIADGDNNRLLEHSPFCKATNKLDLASGFSFPPICVSKGDFKNGQPADISTRTRGIY